MVKAIILIFCSNSYKFYLIHTSSICNVPGINMFDSVLAASNLYTRGSPTRTAENPSIVVLFQYADDLLFRGQA